VEGGERIYAEIVDAINDIYGSHAGVRAVHTKGVLCAGEFVATPEARRLSRAPHLQGNPQRAHVRFSNGGGDPGAHDGAVDGRGMAVKLYLADGSTTDVVAITLPVFFVRTPADFLEFTRARRPDPATGAPDLAKVGAFLEQHPEAVPAIQAAVTAKPPASYLQCSYNGLHAFGLVDADDARTWVRYSWEPEGGEATLEPEEAARLDRDYLRDDLADRLAAGPATFRLWAQIAVDGDPIEDPTAAWPAARERVELGRLEITGLADDRERDGDVLVFDPTRVPDGIVLSRDPILHARPGAYAESVYRRSGVRRAAGATAPAPAP
jgi:catalase